MQTFITARSAGNSKIKYDECLVFRDVATAARKPSRKTGQELAESWRSFARVANMRTAAARKAEAAKSR